MDLKQYIRDIPDFPKQGILFKDITPLIKDPAAFAHSIDLLTDRYRDKHIDKVIGIESRGFIFAAGLALKLGAGMVPVRKVGKLPAKTIKETYELEYGTDCVEVHEDAISRGETVVVIDDVIATGGTLGAACRLVSVLGGQLHEAACVIELTFLEGRKRIPDIPFYSLISY